MSLAHGSHEPHFRRASAHDAQAIARLHADSWRRHYRGAYSDSFLDGDVVADRLVAWSARLGERDASSCTIVAEDGGVVGFAHTIFDHDASWGALLDNMHVSQTHKRRGVGSRLLALTARALLERSDRHGLYLWVLEQNRAAQAFYEARGAERVERAPVSAPGGIPGRLCGSPCKLRYAWRNPARLLDGSEPG